MTPYQIERAKWSMRLFLSDVIALAFVSTAYFANEIMWLAPAMISWLYGFYAIWKYGTIKE